MTITTTDLDSADVPDEPLAAIDGSRVEGRDQNRWHNLTLYAFDDGSYICHVEYKSDWDGERDEDRLIRATDLDDLRDQLRNWSFGYVAGFPPRPQYRQRQENLLNWIRGNFCACGRDLIIAARNALSKKTVRPL